MKRTILLLTVLFCPLSYIYAQEIPDSTNEQPSAPQEAPKAKAQDSYYADPFSDLADMETQDEEESEEAIDRFYAFGRIFHVAAYGEVVPFFGGMSEIYHRGWMMGGRISYFLDWDVAIVFHVGLGKATMAFYNPGGESDLTMFTGSATLFNMGMGLKYYFNLYDVSRALAYLNPAFTAGAEISVVNDKLDMNAIPLDVKVNDPSHKMVAPGLFFGASMEIPLFRKSVYIGADFLYHLSFFPSDNNKIPINDPHFYQLDYSGTYMTLGCNIIFNL